MGKGAGQGMSKGAGQGADQGSRVEAIVRSGSFIVSETEGLVTWSGQRYDLRKLRNKWDSMSPGVPLHLTGVLTSAREWDRALAFIPSSVSGDDLAAYKAWFEAGGSSDCKLDFGEAPGN